MTDKAYIVANEQQEREVLEKLELEGCEWLRSSKNPTDFIPSHDEYNIQFPYCLVLDYDQLGWCNMELLPNYEIIYDGRKEEQMSNKYVVSQKFMDALEEWKLNKVIGIFINTDDITMIPNIIFRWWRYDHVSSEECNNRLIAIIRWVNGEDVFEVEKNKKWVVRSLDTNEDGNYGYVFINLHNITFNTYRISNATKFDTKEEAENWANAHQEVIEVEE